MDLTKTLTVIIDNRAELNDTAAALRYKWYLLALSTMSSDDILSTLTIGGN